MKLFMNLGLQQMWALSLPIEAGIFKAPQSK